MFNHIKRILGVKAINIIFLAVDETKLECLFSKGSFPYPTKTDCFRSMICIQYEILAGV